MGRSSRAWLRAAAWLSLIPLVYLIAYVAFLYTMASGRAHADLMKCHFQTREQAVAAVVESFQAQAETLVIEAGGEDDPGNARWTVHFRKDGVPMRAIFDCDFATVNGMTIRRDMGESR